MSEAGDRGRDSRLSAAVGYVLIVASVWLAWEVVKIPLVVRAPPPVAIRFAPNSPEVLRRAAEAELLAGRSDNARALSIEALAKAPFDARALRVRGLAEARLANVDRADQMLTLAGNWSLRDDPAHAWLTEHRLKSGDYGSAFAHADTLARRRTDVYPSVFRLFTVAAIEDPRSIPFLARLVGAKPSWRAAYLHYLHSEESRVPVVGALAIALEGSPGQFSDAELQQLYSEWAEDGRIAGIKEVRRRIGRPQGLNSLQNGAFVADVDRQILPFGWSLPTSPGLSSALIEDDLNKGNQALRLQYDGFGSGIFAEQLLLLDPGEYVLTGQQRAELSMVDIRMDWHLVCYETGSTTSSASIPTATQDGNWRPLRLRFNVPTENCTAQWLRLQARSGDRRTSIGAWFDNLAIYRSEGADSPL